MPSPDRRYEEPEEYESSGADYDPNPESDYVGAEPSGYDGDTAGYSDNDLDTYWNVGGTGWDAEARERGQMTQPGRRGGESTRNLDEGGVPFGMDPDTWAGLDGGARAQYLIAQQEAERNREILHNLADTIPELDDLSVEYAHEGTTDEYGNLIGPRSELQGFGPSGEQAYAMAALKNLYDTGGYTDADEGARRLASMQRGQQLRGANEAAISQMNARGMGGGGGELGARLSASQGLAQGQAMNDAAIQQAAMMRALQALQGYHSGANTQQDQELARRNALDSFNMSNMDWRRQRESRNTNRTNMSRESEANAYRDQYGMRQGVASLHLGHNPNGAQAAGENAAAAQRGLLDKAAAAGGEILDLV